MKEGNEKKETNKGNERRKCKKDMKEGNLRQNVRGKGKKDIEEGNKRS